MRVTRYQAGLVILGIAVIAMGSLTAASSSPAPPVRSSRLVSVQELAWPEGDMCAWPASPAGADLMPSVDQDDPASLLQRGRPGAFLMASLQQPHLLDALQQGNLFAALRQGRGVSVSPATRPETSPRLQSGVT